MHIVLIVGYLLILGIVGLLLFALLRSRRSLREVSSQLTLAREQQHQHNQQLTELPPSDEIAQAGVVILTTIREPYGTACKTARTHNKPELTERKETSSGRLRSIRSPA